MKLFLFVKLGILKLLSELEFHYFKNNVNVFFRVRYLTALEIVFQKPISIGTQFYVRDRGLLFIGKNCSFGSFTRIWNYAPIAIGDDFLSAGGLTINCGSHDLQTLKPFAKPISIGDRVWVGLNVTILGGVTIGNDVVIGAGSLVVKDIPANSVYAGVPAKRISDLDRTGLSAIWGAWGEIPLDSQPSKNRVSFAPDATNS